MNRVEQLKFCKVCANQKFDFQNGVICGLTNRVADFEVTCPDFTEDSFLREEWEASNRSVDVESQMASAGKRFANLILDTIFKNILLYALFFALGALLALTDSSSTLSDTEAGIWGILGLFIIFLAYFGYYIVFEFVFGKTLGKMITNTRVVDLKGNKPSLGACIGRTFARIIPFNAFSFLGSDASGWHDKLTRTRVIDDY